MELAGRVMLIRKVIYAARSSSPLDFSYIYCFCNSAHIHNDLLTPFFFPSLWGSLLSLLHHEVTSMVSFKVLGKPLVGGVFMWADGCLLLHEGETSEKGHQLRGCSGFWPACLSKHQWPLNTAFLMNSQKIRWSCKQAHPLAEFRAWGALMAGLKGTICYGRDQTGVSGCTANIWTPELVSPILYCIFEPLEK